MIKASKKRFISLIVVAAMIIGILPMGALTAFAAAQSNVVASSAPNIVANGNGQAAGNIVVQEDTDTLAAWGTGNKTLILTLPAGVTYSGGMGPVATGGSGTTVVSTELTADDTLTVTVRGNNNSRDSFTISNIKYDTGAVVAGNVPVTLSGTLPGLTAGSVVINAVVVNGLSVTPISAASTSTIEAGDTSKTVSNITVKESAVHVITADNKLTFTIAKTGVVFSGIPTANVSAGTSMTVDGGTLNGGRTAVTYIVTAESSGTAGTITLTNVKYDAASTVTTGDVGVTVTTNQTSLPITPATAVNAKVVTGGVTAVASSVPVLKKNTNDTNGQSGGNIVITEKAAGNLVASKFVQLDLTGIGADVSVLGTPEATSTGLILTSVTPTSGGAGIYKWTISTANASTGTAGTITISNIKYNVGPNAVSGNPVRATISGEDGSGIASPIALTDATIETVKLATASAPIQLVIPASAEAAVAGDIIISESVKGNLTTTTEVTMTIAPNGFGVNEVFFADAPSLVVTAGNAIVGPARLSTDRTQAFFDIISASTVASTIKVTGIKYNTLGSASGAVFVNVSGAGSSFGQVSNAFVGTLTPTFADVPATHWAFSAIEFLASAGIVNGRTDGNFHPNDSITRGEFAKIICLAAGLTPVTGGSASFSDTSGHWAAGYIEAAKTAGLISGYPDGTFRPNNLITRAEIAKLVVLGAGFATDTSGAGFSDIATNWAKDFILTAANNGVVNGYSDGTFRPNNHATRAEASVMVYNWLSGL